VVDAEENSAIRFPLGCAGDWPADRRSLLAPSPLAALAARKGPSVATAQTDPGSRFPRRVQHAGETRTLQRKLPWGLGSDSSNSPEALRESENTDNFFPQTEIILILLPVVEPETDRVRMLREQGKIYRSGDVIRV
jgi:hypothetical protein